ncbi:MAG: hypothetical protein ABSG69_19680 [Candidatus Acidiferrum sp.]|jgi:NADPH2:quinone reductase
MRAAQIKSFGPPEVIEIVDLPIPAPARGQVLVRVQAAGVAPWDALIRSNASVTAPQLPLVLGSDLSGNRRLLPPRTNSSPATPTKKSSSSLPRSAPPA